MNHELIVDNFAGWGGVSTGIEWATGRPVDIAINHNPAAIAMHKINHPGTKHYCEDVWQVVPLEVTEGRPVALVWLSPDCTHHSKARGGRPKSKNIRGLAWVALRWAATVKPRVIMLENVEELQDWGPLTKEGNPDPKQKGRTFKTFVNALRYQGYHVEWRELRACDYGAPTTRKRLFMIARCDGRPIVWPEPTHGDPKSDAVKSGRLKPWRTAAEIIDWSLSCQSIFERKRPLAENTMRRIARGIQKFVIDNPNPFVLNDQAYFLSQYHSADRARGQILDRPLLTQDASNRYALVSAFITKFYKSGTGQRMEEPLHTITTSPGHFGEVQAFLTAYYGTGIGSDLKDPLPTVVSKDRFGLVVVNGLDYQITDIHMRMLQPRELFNAQGFSPDYIIDRDLDGHFYTKAEQVAGCGNSVSPLIPKALIRANLPDQCSSFFEEKVNAYA